MTADPQTPARFRATELQYRWLEPPPETPGNPKSTRAEPAAAPKKTSVTVPAVPHLIDPWQQWAWQPAVFWRTSDDEAFEIPFRAPEELSELLEFEYVLSDAAAIDALVRQLDVATLKAMARLAEQDDPTRPVVQGELVARPPLLAELQRHPGLLQRLEAPMANVPWNVYVVQPNELTAWTDDLTAPLVPRSLKPLMLAADDAVSDALSALQARIQDALLAIERIAVDFLTTTLDSGLNVIYTEALRYFDFETHGGITAAFEAYKAPMAKAVDAAGASKAGIPTLPLAQGPRRLIETLKALQPFAQAVLDEKARLDATPAFVGGMRPAGPNPGHQKQQEALSKAKQTLALEVGKLRETCPILLAMTPHEMVTAVHADRVLLGRILFPILARAWRANRAIHREAPRWPRPAAAALGAGFVGWPDMALANKLKHVDDAGIWAFRMYVDRAASWRYPDTTSPERSCIERVLEALHGKSIVPELITHLMRDHAVFSAAHAVDKRAAALAMKAGTTALPRLVPVLNWIYAGWGIYNSISEFAESEKRHYCTLDPQDCLATEAPDIASLLVDIELQVAFALI